MALRSPILNRSGFDDATPSRGVNPLISDSCHVLAARHPVLGDRQLNAIVDAKNWYATIVRAPPSTSERRDSSVNSSERVATAAAAAA